MIAVTRRLWARFGNAAVDRVAEPPSTDPPITEIGQSDGTATSTEADRID